MSTSIPLPGQHRPELRSGVDPDQLRSEVDELLAQLDSRGLKAIGNDLDSPDSYRAETAARGGQLIVQQAQILDQAHDLLVAALESVDKG